MLRNNITYSTEIFVRKQITQTLEQIQRYSRKRNELSPKIPIRISILARKNYSNRGQWNRARVVAKTKGMHLERHVTMPSRTCVGVCVSGGGGGARARALCHWIGVNDLNNVYTKHGDPRISKIRIILIAISLHLIDELLRSFVSWFFEMIGLTEREREKERIVGRIFIYFCVFYYE